MHANKQVRMNKTTLNKKYEGTPSSRYKCWINQVQMGFTKLRIHDLKVYYKFLI